MSSQVPNEKKNFFSHNNFFPPLHNKLYVTVNICGWNLFIRTIRKDNLECTTCPGKFVIHLSRKKSYSCLSPFKVHKLSFRVFLFFFTKNFGDLIHFESRSRLGFWNLTECRYILSRKCGWVYEWVETLSCKSLRNFPAQTRRETSNARMHFQIPRQCLFMYSEFSSIYVKSVLVMYWF